MRILDRILTALLSAAFVLFALAVWQPWDADVSAVDSHIAEAVAVHAAEPLDVNDSIIVRWEYPDGTEAMPPEVMPLWRYVWLPQSELQVRVSRLETVACYPLKDPVMRGHLERHGMTPEQMDHLLWYIEGK